MRISDLYFLIKKITEEKLYLVKTQITRISNIIHKLVESTRPSVSIPKPTDITKLLESAVSIVKMGRETSNIRFIPDLKTGFTKSYRSTGAVAACIYKSYYECC